MSQKENQERNAELEALVKNLFQQSRQKSGISAKKRLRSILESCLHEIALRDLLIFSSHLIFAMLTMCSLFVRPFLNKP
jgi:hypothetical protein